MNNDWTPGTWWRAPAEKRFWAYYLCLRIHYEMPALEAFRYAKQQLNDWGLDLIGTCRKALIERENHD